MADGQIRRFVTAVFDRLAAKKVETEFEKSLANAGKAGAKGFLKELRAAFDKQMASLKEKLASGLINQKEFKRQAEAAGKAFNVALTKNIAEARKAGTLTEKEYIKLSRQFKNTGDEGASAWGRIKDGIKGAAVALAAAFSVREIIRFVGGSIREFADFDLAMTQSLSIMKDVDEAMRVRMVKAARQVSKELNLSATEVARAFFFLASAGLDAEQALAALPTVARFAKAGAFDLARATDLLTDAQSALGLTVRDNTVKNMENMARVSDVLTKANILSNATVEQFSEAMTNKAGPALRQVNKDVEEGAAVLAVYADQGVKGAAAGDQLSIVLRELQRASRENRKEFDRLKIRVFDSNGELRNMADIIGELERALGPMSTELKGATLSQLGFTEKSISSLKALLGTSEAMRAYEVELRKAAGTTQSVSDKQMKAFAERWGQVKQEMAAARGELGLAVINALNLEKNLPRLIALVAAFGRHVGNLVGLLGSLFKALVLVAGAKGFLALRAGILAAEGAIALFRIGLTRLFVALGPTGWLVIGLTTIIELFRRSGQAAKDAADRTKEAIASFKESLATVSEIELMARKAHLETQKRMDEERLALLKAIPVFHGQASEAPRGFSVSEQAKRLEEIAALEKRLNDIKTQGLAIDEEIKSRARAAASGAKPEDGEDGLAALLGADPKALAKALEDTLLDLATVRRRIETGLTEQQALEQVKRERLLAGHKDRETATIAELKKAWDDLATARALANALEPGPRITQMGQLGRPTETQRPGALPIPEGGIPLPDMEEFGRRSAEAAEVFSDPWYDALDRIGNQVSDSMGLFDDLSAAWAGAGIAGIVRLAFAKIRENIAAAAEELAKAAAAFATGNTFAAGLHTKAAAAHKTAAVLWGVAGAAGAGAKLAGVGGGGGGGGGLGRNPSFGEAQRAQPITTENHIYFDGPDFTNPKLQREVRHMVNEAGRRDGNNARTVVHGRR